MQNENQSTKTTNKSKEKQAVRTPVVLIICLLPVLLLLLVLLLITAILLSPFACLYLICRLPYNYFDNKNRRDKNLELKKSKQWQL